MKFLSSKMSTPTLKSTQPRITRYRDSFPEIKLPWHEVDQSPQSGAEFENEINYIFTPSISLYGMYRDKFAREVTETGAC